MNTPKASGPLWGLIGDPEEPIMIETLDNYEDAFDVDEYPVPCRLIPGHGKVVPLELVEEAMRQYDIKYIADGPDEDLCPLYAAIDAAVKGAV